MLTQKQHNYPTFTNDELVCIKEEIELELELWSQISPTEMWGSDIKDAEERWNKCIEEYKSIINKISEWEALAC